MLEFSFGDLFTGQLVRLAAMQPDDKAALARWTNDAEYFRQMHFKPARPLAPEAFEEKPDDHHHDRSRHFHFMFRTLAGDQLIGHGGLSQIHWSHQTTKIWIGIGEPDYRSKGYGTDAMRLLVNYAFRELNFYRVGLEVFAYNTRAIRVYEKLGFKHEGTQREALYRDGERHDLLSLSLLREEWEALRQFYVLSVPEQA